MQMIQVEVPVTRPGTFVSISMMITMILMTAHGYGGLQVGNVSAFQNNSQLNLHIDTWY